MIFTRPVSFTCSRSLNSVDIAWLAEFSQGAVQGMSSSQKQPEGRPESVDRGRISKIAVVPIDVGEKPFLHIPPC
jgi:hypothetical protein